MLASYAGHADLARALLQLGKPTVIQNSFFN